MKKFLTILVACLFCITGCGVNEESRNLEESQADSVDNDPMLIQESSIDTTGWSSYQNNQYGFSLVYPTDWKVWEESSNTYPTQTTGNKYLEYMTLKFKIQLTNYPAQPSYRDSVYFSVVDFNLDTLLKKIDSFGRDSNGESLTSVGALETVLIGDVKATKSTHVNPNDMVTTFYYIPLIDSEMALFIYYQDMLEEERKNKVEEIIHHHLDLYPPLEGALEASSRSEEDGLALYSKDEVQFYYPEQWNGKIIDDQVIESIHYQEIKFYDSDEQVKMALLCPEWQGGIESAVDGYNEQKKLLSGNGVSTISFVIYKKGELPGFAYLHLPASSKGENCSLTFTNIQTQSDIDVVNSIHESVALLN